MHLHLILILNPVFCFLGAAGTDFIWNNEKRLGQYQSAWNSMNKPSKSIYYQTKATSLMTISGGSPGNAYKCWSVRYTDLNPATETGMRNYYCALASTMAVYFAKEPVKTVPTLNYTEKNGVEYVYNKAGDRGTDPVIFTDGKTCDLFSVPRLDTGEGCELWVNSE
uniref:Secreted protein n=1 Tax=Amblyomma americanum TaxID=6943 RepID=A0A0C9SDV2_AMBAM